MFSIEQFITGQYHCSARTINSSVLIINHSKLVAECFILINDEINGTMIN